MSSVFVIAEIGINHGGDFDRAQAMVASVAACGADMAKFQLYDPAKVLGEDSPHLDEANRCQLTREQHRELKKLCESKNIEYGVSIFDEKDVPFTEVMGVGRYKVASRSAKDTALLDAIRATGKPVIMSCGMVDDDELIDSMRHLGRDVTLLHCVPEYPTAIERMDLGMMDKLAGVSGGKTGLSSHCPSMSPTLAAVARGASCVENHVKDHDFQGVDSSSSMNFDEFSYMVELIREMEKL